MKIKHLNSAHAGQGRVLSIYERGVGRHSGCAPLWKEYLAYTANVKASKRFRRTMTNALRMMPRDSELWVMAGRRSARHGDMASARAFFMRGCHFCTSDSTLWVEYARCEMEWLEKVDKRTKDKPQNDPLRPDKTDGDEDELVIADSEEDSDDEAGTLLPEPPKSEAKVIDKQSTKQLQNNPAMDGAIPIAIFDISKKQKFFGPDSAERFFILFASFRDVSVQPRISQHVLGFMDEVYPNSPATANCHIRQPIVGVNPHSAEFAKNLREVLARLRKYSEETEDRLELESKTAAWIDGYLALETLDEGIRQVLQLTRSKLSVE